MPEWGFALFIELLFCEQIPYAVCGAVFPAFGCAGAAHNTLGVWFNPLAAPFNVGDSVSLYAMLRAFFA